MHVDNLKYELERMQFGNRPFLDCIGRDHLGRVGLGHASMIGHCLAISVSQGANG